MFAKNQSTNSALGAALQVGYKLLVRYLCVVKLMFSIRPSTVFIRREDYSTTNNNSQYRTRSIEVQR